VATFTVTYKDNQFYCDYSENLANILDEYLCESNAGQPLCCYVNTQNEMCITSGERTYNLNNEQDVEYQEIQIECESHQFNPNCIEYEYHYQTSRSVVSYYQWTNYHIGTPEGLNCGPITLYNIYRNLPYYHTYTDYSTYRSHMNPLYYNYYGEGFNGTLTNYEVMRKYLIADDYSIGYQSGSGRMTESQISTTILNHHRYIMAFMKTTSGAGHIVGVVGETVNNTSVIYYIFDPHSGIHTTIEAGFSLFYCGDIYYWTGGYLGDFY